jgi:hypothetical protein
VIDFRYHLVSLISVFLALAVGIALGAGPLKETIGDQLTGQVEQLRAEKDALRAELDATSAQRGAYEAYLDAAAEDLVGGILPRDVAVVTLPGAGQATVEGIVSRVEQSGATVAARVDVAEKWTDEAQRDARASLVSGVLGYLEPAPAGDATAEAVLGAALAQALTAADAQDPQALSENAGLLLDLLTEAELVTVPGEPAGPVDGVVVVAPAASANATATAAADEAAGVAMELVDALDAASGGTVVAGPAATAGELVSRIRDDAGLAPRVATVDTVVDITGQLSVPRALATAIAGTSGHYGFASSASSVLPPRTQLEPEAQTAGAAG